MPAGLVLSPDGTISGTANFASPWSFTISAVDSMGVSKNKQMAIVSIGVPPTLARVFPHGTALPDCPVGIPCTAGVGIQSGGRAPFTWSVSGLPAGMDIRFGEGNVNTSVNPVDAELWGISTTPGTYMLTVTATDADGKTAAGTFPLTITELFQEQFLSGPTYGVPYSSKMRVIGGEVPHTSSIVGGRLPLGLSLNPATHVVSGTPLEHGGFSFLVRFTDAGGRTIERWNGVFVAGVGTTLQISGGDDLGFASEGAAYSRTLFACCVPSYSWSIVGGALPAGLSMSPAGVITGTPAAGASTAMPGGVYNFLVEVEDATNPANFAVRQFKLTVTTVATSGNSGLPFGNVGTFYTTTLTSNPGGLTWSVEPFQYLPAGLTLSAAGVLSGVPTTRGYFSFNVRATNGTQSTTRSYTILIYAAGENPPLDLPFGPNVGPGMLGSWTFSINSPTGGVAPYTLSYAPGAPEIPGYRVQSGGPLPTFISSSAPYALVGIGTTAGVYPTTLRVTDSVGQILDKPIVVTISPLVHLSPTTLPRASVGTPYSFLVTATGGSGNYQWSATNLPAGLSIDAAGEIAGTPTTSGSVGPTITVTDLTLVKSMGMGYSITVNAFPITTAGALPTATTGVVYNQVMAAPGCGAPCVWSLQGSVPAGLSLNGAGVLSGTPTGATGGTSFTVQASGPGGVVTKVFGIRINAAVPAALSISTASLNDLTFGNFTSQTLSVSGGVAPYTWSLDSGALPDSISIHQNGDLLGATLSPVQGLLGGRPLTLGVHNFTLRVTDSVGGTTTRVLSWRVTPLNFPYTSLPVSGSTVISGGSSSSLVYNVAYSQPLLVAGGTGSYTFTSGPMPPGLVLSAAGVVSGAPLNTGSFSVPVTATDGMGAAHTQSVSFTVASGTPATVSFGLGAALGVAQLGVSQTHSTNPSGGTGPYTLTALTPLPPGYVFQGTQIIGHATTPGSYSFTVQATDSLGNFGVRTFSLAVASIAIAPGFASLPDGSVGVAYSRSIATIGAPGTTFAVTTGSVPGGLTLLADGTISGTPTTPGTSNFTVAATNGVTITQSYSIRISSIVLTDPEVLPAALFGQEYDYTLTATGGGTGKVFTGFGFPNGMFISSTGQIQGVPTNVNTTLFGPTVTVTDTSGTLSRKFLITVTSPNPSVLDIPAGSTVFVDAVVGQSFNSVLSANGGVPPYVWSVAPGSTLPAGLALMLTSPTVTIPGSTALLGVPQTAGTYAFDLIVTDSTGDTARRTYTLKVSSIGFIPISGATSTINVALSTQLQGFGGTAPYGFSIAAVGTTQEMLPPGVTMTPGGLVSGTPTSTGQYQGAITIQDAVGVTFTRRMTWTIVSGGSNLFVSTFNPIMTIGRPVNQNLTLSLSGAGSLPATVNWTLVSGALPPGMMLSSDPLFVNSNQTWLIGQPTAPGTYVYTLRGTNAANAAQFADHRFTATVNGMVLSNLVVYGGTLAEVGTPYSLQLRVAGGVAPYTFTPSPTIPLPAGLALSPAGLISGTPLTTGNLTVAFTFSDSTGATQSGSVALIITTPGEVAPLQALSTAPTFNMVVAGYPFATSIGQWVRGGMAPYTYTVAPGSSLPPGTNLYPGNGFTYFLGGIPTTPDYYEFDLIVSDSSGQSVTLSFDGEVGDGGLTVGSLPTGRVGTPYLASVAPFGGVPPYTMGIDPTNGLPAGLTIANNGVLSGTPTSVGNHTVVAYVVDSVGGLAYQFYRLAIDNAAGEAPAMSLSPNPIDIYYQVGSPAPVVPIAVQMTSGSAPFALHLADAPWATLSAPGGVAPASVNLLVNPGVGVGTYFGVLSASSNNGASNVSDPVPIRLTVVPAPPCTYSINPTSASIAAAGGAGGFDVAAGVGCDWTAVSSDPWITVTGGAAGSAAGSVTYSVAANGAAAVRNGTITVNGAVFAISQFGSSCSFAINPMTIGAPATGGVAEVMVTASSACGAGDVWTAVGLGATPSNGTGNGIVTLTIPPNGAAGSLVLNATIAGALFTVNQAGAACTVALGAAGASHTVAGGPGAVGVNTPVGCPYSTVTGPSWISVTSGGSGIGSGTLVYAVEPNSSTIARSGALTIGGEIFTITQEALACSATLDTSTLANPVAAGGGVGSVGITMNGANCGWTASSPAGWAVVGPAAGTGNGNVLVTAASNAASTTGRSTTLTIAGQSVLLNQAGTVCTYGLLSSTGSVPASGGAGSAGVVAPSACAWAAVSNDPWLSISSSAAGGTGNANFVAQSNPTSLPRSGTLTVAGLTYTINQAAAPCVYTLNPTNIAVASTGASSDFAISTVTGGCAPEAVSYASWAHVSTAFGGMAGTVSYTVDPNPSATTRIGIVQVGNSNFTITQLGAACAYSLNVYGAWFNSAGGFSSFLGSPSGIGCAPVVGVDLPTIVTMGALTGPVLNIFMQEYEVSPFTGVLTPVVRKARITFGGRIFIVKQSSW